MESTLFKINRIGSGQGKYKDRSNDANMYSPSDEGGILSDDNLINSFKPPHANESSQDMYKRSRNTLNNSR